MKSLEEVRELFKNDRFATENDAVIDEIGDCFAKCSMKLSERHRNALGAVMGGAVFTLADFAFAVASNWQEAGMVSLSSNITYLDSAKGDVLTAEAACIKNGRNTSCYEIDVCDNAGILVATVITTGFRRNSCFFD